MSTPFIVVLTTFSKKADARRISRLLTRKKLAACVNILNAVESFFWWEGKVERVKENLVLIKTKSSQFSALRKFLEKNHPYSVPEIIALPVQKGNAPYLNWLQASLR